MKRNSSQVVMFLQCLPITREIEILCRNFTHFRHNFYELVYPQEARTLTQRERPVNRTTKIWYSGSASRKQEASVCAGNTGLGAFIFLVPDPAKPEDAMETSATSTRGVGCACQG